MPTIFLRSDDVGLSAGTNLGAMEASRTCPNLGIMATGPALADAAERLRGHSELCLGLHFTLNSEWNRLRWGPVSPRERVPSLVRDDGTFYPNPWKLPSDVTYSVNEVEWELHAQLEALRNLGLDIRYLDSHMAVFKTRPELTDLALRFAAAEGLAYPDQLEGIRHGPYSPDEAENLARWETILRELDERPRLAVFHPARPDGVMEQLNLDEPVLSTRAAECALLASEAFARLLRDRGVRVARIDALRPPR